ncbi:MAG TPA: hypothetical protein VMT22_07150 [Terriglobales bacterium]|nr:hypothetical protein [Terriglobales bacterium]
MDRISIIRAILASALIIFSLSSARAETETELIARGRYIATAIQGCGCHTREQSDGRKDETLHYAGSPNPAPPAGPPANAGWSSARWKKIYARNITPDLETGIGQWSEADFMRAMRTGITPDGRVLDTQMPWNAFQKITDRDLKSLWAYLKTIKPIKNTPPQNIPADRK